MKIEVGDEHVVKVEAERWRAIDFAIV